MFAPVYFKPVNHLKSALSGHFNYLFDPGACKAELRVSMDILIGYLPFEHILKLRSKAMNHPLYHHYRFEVLLVVGEAHDLASGPGTYPSVVIN